MLLTLSRVVDMEQIFEHCMATVLLGLLGDGMILCWNQLSNEFEWWSLRSQLKPAGFRKPSKLLILSCFARLSSGPFPEVVRDPRREPTGPISTISGHQSRLLDPDGGRRKLVRKTRSLELQVGEAFSSFKSRRWLRHDLLQVINQPVAPPKKS